MLRRRRGPEGGAGPRGPRRDSAGPGGRTAALCPPPPGSRGPTPPRSRGPPPPPAVTPCPCHDSTPGLPAPPLVLALRCSPSRLLASERSASHSPRPPAPGFPGRRLGKVEEEEAEEEEEEAAT